jgi:hypothetical protein
MDEIRQVRRRLRDRHKTIDEFELLGTSKASSGIDRIYLLAG